MFPEVCVFDFGFCDTLDIWTFIVTIFEIIFPVWFQCLKSLAPLWPCLKMSEKVGQISITHLQEDLWATLYFARLKLPLLVMKWSPASEKNCYTKVLSSNHFSKRVLDISRKFGRVTLWWSDLPLKLITKLWSLVLKWIQPRKLVSKIKLIDIIRGNYLFLLLMNRKNHWSLGWKSGNLKIHLWIQFPRLNLSFLSDLDKTFLLETYQVCFYILPILCILITYHISFKLYSF